jgi:hypothetical protein
LNLQRACFLENSFRSEQTPTSAQLQLVMVLESCYLTYTVRVDLSDIHRTRKVQPTPNPSHNILLAQTLAHPLIHTDTDTSPHRVSPSPPLMNLHGSPHLPLPCKLSGRCMSLSVLMCSRGATESRVCVMLSFPLPFPSESFVVVHIWSRRC